MADYQAILRFMAGLQNLQNAIARSPQSLFTTTANNSPLHHGQHQSQKTFFTPAFDFLETVKEYILEGELPGLRDKEQTMIVFPDAQTVSIRGKIERREESKKNKEDGDKIWATERKVGEFRRDFTFPGSINVEAVRATLEHGVLRIVVPKATEVGARRILIQ